MKLLLMKRKDASVIGILKILTLKLFDLFVYSMCQFQFLP